MAFGKWLGGVLGFMSGGPLGALAGFALGALFDKGVDSVNQPYTNKMCIRDSDVADGFARYFSIGSKFFNP